MSNELLEKELRDLPEESIADVIDYIKFLKYRRFNAENNLPATVAKRKHSERKLGVLQGTFIMSDDFDDTSDCFKN